MKQREIKFRAWDSKRKIMDAEPYGDEFLCEGTPINKAVSAYPFDEEGGCILMQFTGVKDKNGREICEGDVFRFVVPADAELQNSDIEYTEEVQFVDGVFCLDGFVPVSTFCGDGEVIGNIYENPDLLHA